MLLPYGFIITLMVLMVPVVGNTQISLPTRAHLLNISRGSDDIREVALTFNGASGKRFARDILKTLKEKQIVTTIFLTGRFIKRYPEVVLEMVENGHEIGSHTFTHPRLTTYSDTWRHDTLPGIDKVFLQKELSETAMAFKELTGKDMVSLWRAPYGEINREILKWSFEAGYTHVFWTIDKKENLDTLDWVSDKKSAFYLTSEEIKSKILNFGKQKKGLNGGIILMHFSNTRKDDQPHLKLGEIIDELREAGYRFVTVAELIRDVALKSHGGT